MAAFGNIRLRYIGPDFYALDDQRLAKANMVVSPVASVTSPSAAWHVQLADGAIYVMDAGLFRQLDMSRVGEVLRCITARGDDDLTRGFIYECYGSDGDMVAIVDDRGRFRMADDRRFEVATTEDKRPAAGVTMASYGARGIGQRAFDAIRGAHVHMTNQAVFDMAEGFVTAAANHWRDAPDDATGHATMADSITFLGAMAERLHKMSSEFQRIENEMIAPAIIQHGERGEVLGDEAAA